MAKKLGDQYIVGPPNLKVGGPVSPGAYGCCAYAYIKVIGPRSRSQEQESVSALCVSYLRGGLSSIERQSCW